VVEGVYKSKDTFINFKEVWNLFDNHKLKLVLQGHQHLFEEIKVKGVQFLTGGAVSACWWGGSFYGTEEGFVLLELEDDNFSYSYVDYGWDAGSCTD
jgi:hypothetical protein